mgnify:CR=1 FL=1
MLTLSQLDILRHQYLALLKLEVEAFGVQPTEVRHLIGRLGEIHAALLVKGQLAHKVNQHGFDVIDPQGQCISVKTTAQTSGFVTLSGKTHSKAQQLMLLQYVQGELSTVYHGPMALVAQEARDYRGNLELDLSKARSLQARLNAAQPPGSA